MKYPIGIQEFEKIINGGYVYVDKNHLIHQLVKEGSIYFLSFWGHDCNLNYYVNGEYPLAYEGWGATADVITVEPGDFIDIGKIKTWVYTVNVHIKGKSNKIVG